jgi:hypothetical protein
MALVGQLEVRRGSTRDAATGRLVGRPPLERFWAMVDSSAGPDACWPFLTGAGNRKGYRLFWIGGGRGFTPAHRYSYEVHKGPIPDGLWILHSCDNPRCVNPAHLRAGTALENSQDARERHRGIGAPRGHANGASKLTEDDVRHIRRLLAAGVSQHEVARQHGVSQSTVSDIRHGRLWSHLDAEEGVT